MVLLVQERQNQSKHLVHNLEDLFSYLTVMRHSMEKPWVEYLSVYAKLEHGAVSMSLTDWRKECFLLYPSRF